MQTTINHNTSCKDLLCNVTTIKGVADTSKCGMYDIAFGFKSPSLFQVNDVVGCAFAAQAVGQYAYIELMREGNGDPPHLSPEVLALSLHGELSYTATTSSM